MDVAGRDQKADRAAFRIDPRVDLGGEASSALAHTTISTLFWPGGVLMDPHDRAVNHLPLAVPTRS